MHAGSTARHWITRWAALLDGPDAALIEALTSADEWARVLIQTSHLAVPQRRHPCPRAHGCGLPGPDRMSTGPEPLDDASNDDDPRLVARTRCCEPLPRGQPAHLR